MADTKEDGEDVESPGIMSEEDNEQREGLQGHTHDPDASATEALRYHRHRAPYEYPRALLDGKHPGSHPNRQAAVDSYSHHEHIYYLVAHASPAVDADEVPEGASGLCLSEEHTRPYLGRLILLRAFDGLVFRSAQRPQAYLSGLVVKEPSQQQYQRSARYAGNPENPLHAQLVEGRAYHEDERNNTHALERPHNPHCHSKIPPEPQCDA